MSAEIYVATQQQDVSFPTSPAIENYAGPYRLWRPAQRLIEEGMDGLSAIDKRLGGVTSTLSPEGVDTLRRRQRLNTAAVVMGVALHSLEGSLVTKDFSELDFVIEYSGAVGDFNLGLPSLTPETLGVVPIEPERHRRMLDLAKKDKTLASFFYADHFDDLPVGMQRLLMESGMIYEIRIPIAPAFVERQRRRALPTAA